MEFLNVRELRSPKDVWAKLSQKGELVLTNNGKPTALLLNLPDGQFEDALRAVRQAKVMRSFNLIREEAAERGYLTDEEIANEIRLYREEKEKGKNGDK